MSIKKTVQVKFDLVGELWDIAAEAAFRIRSARPNLKNVLDCTTTLLFVAATVLKTFPLPKNDKITLQIDEELFVQMARSAFQNVRAGNAASPSRPMA